jgi:hypothetical protein
MPNKLHMQDVSVSCPLQDDDGGQDARAGEEHGPWRCLAGCVTHRDSTPGDDTSECYASERVGATRLSDDPRGVALEVAVDQYAERHIAHLRAAVAAAGASDPHEALRATTGGDS